MNLKNFVLPAIAGAIVALLLGYLAYGVLFRETMASPIAGVDRKPEDIIWWAMITGNLAYGFLLAYVVAKSGAFRVVDATITCAVIGLFLSLTFDLIFHATSYLMTPKKICTDVLIMIVMSAITGSVIGWVASMGSKKMIPVT